MSNVSSFIHQNALFDALFQCSILKMKTYYYHEMYQCPVGLKSSLRLRDFLVVQ